MSTDDLDDDDLHDQFLKYVAAYEEREPSTLFELLPQSGVSLPAPEELSDEEVGRKLWEVIQGLSLCGVFLHNRGICRWCDRGTRAGPAKRYPGRPWISASNWATSTSIFSTSS